MSSQNNKDDLTNLLAYLRADNPDKEMSPVAGANQKRNIAAPPPHVKEALRRKITERSKIAESERSQANAPLRFPAKRPWALAAAAMLIAGILAGFFWVQRQGAVTPFALSEQPQRSAFTLQAGQTLADSGLSVRASGQSAQIHLEKGKRNHIFVKAGSVQVDIRKQLLATEPWFHTPHATITREGTSFTLTVTPALTRITLSEGKIGIYEYAGPEIRKKVVDAPSTVDLVHKSPMETDKTDFGKLESEIDRLNNPSIQKTVTTQLPRVTLILKNGDSVSGVIIKSDSTHIFLQNPRGTLKIPKSDIKE